MTSLLTFPTTIAQRRNLIRAQRPGRNVDRRTIADRSACGDDRRHHACSLRKPPARDYGRNAEPQRYPDPDIVVINGPTGFKAKVGNTAIKRLSHRLPWAEGPAWNAQGQYLLFSDIPANRHLRYLDDDGHLRAVPQTLQRTQRQHLRFRGTAGDLRTHAAGASRT